MCVSAAPDTLYVAPFADESQWICLRLEDISRLRSAWGFLRRSHPAATDLIAGFPADVLPPVPRRFTLIVRFPHGASDDPHATPVMEVVDIEHEGWFEFMPPSLVDPSRIDRPNDAPAELKTAPPGGRDGR